MAPTKAKIGVLGASGYTGSELVRLLLRHPHVEIALLTADRRAGKPMAEVFPQFAPYALPMLTAIEGTDWQAAGLDLGMAQQQPHQLGAGVARRPEHADFCLFSVRSHGLNPSFGR